jgi:hypothetical protein
MKVTATFLSLFVSSSAFTSSKYLRSIALNMADDTVEDVVSEKAAVAEAPSTAATAVAVEYYDVENALGAQAPLGFFDPLGLLYKADEEEFNDLRTKEVVHGRISMLAFVGYLTTYAGIRIPGCEDIPSGMGALTLEGYPADTLTISFITLWTLVYLQYDHSTLRDDVPAPESPGDFRNGLDRFNWSNRSQDYKEEKMAIEINNGRGKLSLAKLRTPYPNFNRLILDSRSV